MKCDSCKNKKGETLQRDESGDGSYFEYCSKEHWEGSGLQDESLEWENCPDFERDTVNTSIKIIYSHGKRLYVNAHGYIHCNHDRDPLIRVPTSFGNVSFICNQCGEVVKREFT